jgi:hypothetical protein
MIVSFCSSNNLVHASDCYWKILAEHARRQLEDQLRDNRQVHY